MKRFLIIILTLILCFSFPLSVFADSGSQYIPETGDVNGDGFVDYNDWTGMEKAKYWVANAAFVLSSVYHLNLHAASTDWNNLANRTAATRGYQNFSEFLVGNSTYVPANQNPEQPESHFEFTPTALEVFNEIKVELEEEAKYINFYPTDSSYLFQENVTSFPNVNFMNALNNVIQNNPDKYFYIVNNRTTQTAGEGCYILYWFDNDIAGVINDFNSITGDTNVMLFDADSWDNSASFDVSSVTFMEWTWSDYGIYYSNDNEFLDVTLEDLGSLDLNTVQANKTVRRYVNNVGWDLFLQPHRYNYFSLSNSPYGSDVFYAFRPWYNGPYSTLLCSGSGGIPVFESLNELKLGTAGRSGISPLPNYQFGQPITNNTVSTSSIQNIVNNYNTENPDNPIQVVDPSGTYPSSSPDGSGGSGSGSDDSGGGFWDKILSGALSGLGAAIKGIFALLADIITSLVETVTKVLTDVRGLFTNGFVDFVSAIFPFMPEEWITLITLGLTLLILGVIIKLLRG